MKSPVNVLLGKHCSDLNTVLRETRCVLESPSVWCIVGRGLKRARESSYSKPRKGRWSPELGRGRW